MHTQKNSQCSVCHYVVALVGGVRLRVCWLDLQCGSVWVVKATSELLLLALVHILAYFTIFKWFGLNVARILTNHLFQSIELFQAAVSTDVNFALFSSDFGSNARKGYMVKAKKHIERPSLSF